MSSHHRLFGRASTNTRPPVGTTTRWAIGLAGFAIVAAGCTPGSTEVSPATTLADDIPTTTVAERSSDGVLTIGVYLPTTGEGAPLGGPMIEAVRDTIARINDAGGVLDRDVALVEVDEAVGTGLDELLAQNVDAIVGPASSTIALGQLATVVQSGTGVVTCSPSATALALDDFPDNGFFFRTVPSDSLQMEAIALRADRTGANSAAIAYLDDPYGRGLFDALHPAIVRRGLAITAEVPFSGDKEDLSEEAARLLDQQPGTVIVLGDADDGARLLSALDLAARSNGGRLPQVIVNDSIRSARQTIQSLSAGFRSRLIGVAPSSSSDRPDAPEGFFAPHAVDCVNLIALAALQAASDAPTEIRKEIVDVSVGGRECPTFEDCAGLIELGLGVDYDGLSGPIDMSNAAGDVTIASFDAFRFGDDGVEVEETRSSFAVETSG